MGQLTEREIFSCMADNFGMAIQHCEDLASLPLKGPTYNLFRHELRLIEGCCRQASAWREDTRWLVIGKLMAAVHLQAGEWLRGVQLPSGRRVPVPFGMKHPMFLALAGQLRLLKRQADEFRTKATGKIGMILPEYTPGPHRDTVPVGWTPAVGGSGLILPVGAA